MYIEQLNGPVLKLDDGHPAKRFLLAFIECRDECVGRELALPGEVSIDQRWQSVSDGRIWTFSAFAYGYLSTDIELDGFITNAGCLTVSENHALEELPRFRRLMDECTHAARQSGNVDCLKLIRKVKRMLELWSQYLDYRQVTVRDAHR